ncbi:MAG: FGGY-family carbohydrate kinase [Spirochaetales bacterium]|nr:FGGY-family carbohydrate kinase [Spirochaetales bacterium]MCF7937768.1 FGGY-family carbohydrate kinase [Spirochaetales bacterium]
MTTDTPREVFFSLDIGTSSLKGAFIDREGAMYAFARRPLPVWDERLLRRWPPETWIDSLTALYRDLNEDADESLRLAGVIVSGNGPTVISVDREGQPVAPALLWFDENVQPVEGNPSFFLPKISWFRDQYPELYERTRWFLGCPEYLAYVLTGTATVFVPNEAFRRYIWDEQQVLSYRIDSEKLPPPVGPGQRIGRIGRHGAARTGLPEELAVYSGSTDFLVSLLGTGAVRPGRICDRAGSSEGLNYCSSEFVQNASIRTLPHIIPGCYNVAAVLPATGRLFEWFRRNTGQTERSYKEIMEEILSIPFSRQLPVFFPSYRRSHPWDFNQAVFLGLKEKHGRSDLGRALVLSIAFTVRHALGFLEEQVGSIEEIVLSGGQGKNEYWNRMKADATGKRLLVPRILDAELVGNLVCTLQQEGEYGDLAEASEALVKVERVYEPDSAQRLMYEDAYRSYQKTYSEFEDALHLMGFSF